MAQSQMFRSLEHRNARLFFLGLSVSNIGSWIQMTAVSLLVYQLTGQATDVGVTLFCQFLPMLVLGVWAGAVVRSGRQAEDDHADPKWSGGAGPVARRARTLRVGNPSGHLRRLVGATAWWPQSTTRLAADS